MEKLKGRCDNIESLEEMIDIERDLERYQNKENKTSANISNGLV